MLKGSLHLSIDFVTFSHNSKPTTLHNDGHTYQPVVSDRVEQTAEERLQLNKGFQTDLLPRTEQKDHGHVAAGGVVAARARIVREVVRVDRDEALVHFVVCLTSSFAVIFFYVSEDVVTMDISTANPDVFPLRRIGNAVRDFYDVVMSEVFFFITLKRVGVKLSHWRNDTFIYWDCVHEPGVINMHTTLEERVDPILYMKGNVGIFCLQSETFSSRNCPHVPSPVLPHSDRACSAGSKNRCYLREHF